MTGPKILIGDIETSPNMAYVWRFWKENISPKQVLEHSHIMSYAAKWLHSKEIIYEDNQTDNDYKIVSSLCNLLDEADIFVAHFGSKFDLPKIKARALVHGIKPPSPVKIIDTKVVASKEFNFPSNSLEYLSEVLGCSVKKKSHAKFPGFVLWTECLKGNQEAWKEMKEYNIDDVLSLEEIYLKMRPWISNHPNVALFEESDVPKCPKCGSTHMHKRGKAFLQTGLYSRYQCQSCGGWSRTRYKENKKNENLLGNLL